MNLYEYAVSNPVNFTDPFGLFGEPWGITDGNGNTWTGGEYPGPTPPATGGFCPINGDKFKDGFYFGTGWGDFAVDYYAEKYLETGNPFWIIPGALAGAWTPETYLGTAGILAGGVGFAKSVPKWAHWEHQRGPHKYPHIQIGKIRIRVPKKVLDFLRKKVKWRNIFK